MDSEMDLNSVTTLKCEELDTAVDKLREEMGQMRHNLQLVTDGWAGDDEPVPFRPYYLVLEANSAIYLQRKINEAFENGYRMANVAVSSSADNGFMDRDYVAVMELRS